MTGVQTCALPIFLVAGAGLGTVIAPLLNVILGGVPPRDAGSSSGVLTTFQQLGGAIGVAIVGVAFFSLVSGAAPRSVADVTPALRAQLAAQHLPAPAVASAVTTFGRCFDRQASSSNPTRTPPGCPPVSAALDQAGLSAVGHDFASATERVLFLQVGFWALTGLLAIFLPRARREVAHGG